MTRRNGRRYYYRNLKIDGKVRSTYVGGGAVGEEAARQQAERDAERLKQRDELRQLRETAAATTRTLDQFANEVELLLRAAFISSGWNFHAFGEWRIVHGRVNDRIDADALAVRIRDAGA